MITAELADHLATIGEGSTFDALRRLDCLAFHDGGCLSDAGLTCSDVDMCHNRADLDS